MLTFLYTLKNNWQLGLLFLVFFPVLLRLGIWQLERAEEKQTLISTYQKQLSQPAVSVTSLSVAERVPYRTVMVQGVFDSQHYWLLDNRPRAGRTGYEVVMPLQTDNGMVLINRGWLEAPLMREQLPVIDTPDKIVSLSGHLYLPQKNAVIQHSQSDLTVEWPKRVIQLDINEAEQLLGQTVLPLLLRLDAYTPGAFITEWPMNNVSAEKHQGYAVQWFSMAVALLFLYSWLLIKSFRESSQTSFSP